MRQRDTVDFSIYSKGLLVLARNPLIIVFPLLAAALEIAVAYIQRPLFDPIGGNDFGLTGLIINLIDGFGFALAIIAAETAWRNRKPTFEGTWDEGGRKLGSIFMATLGLIFMWFVAAMLGGFTNIRIVAELAQLAATYFLIYTIPAAAIGGIPGGAALQYSIERVRGNYLGAAVLTIVAVVLYNLFVPKVGLYLTLPLGVYAPYGIIILKAVILGYLGVVFARQYDDVGFFRPY